MRAFLDENYDKQLKILSYIDQKKKLVSIKQISVNTNISEKTVLQIIRKFEQESFFSNHQLEITYANKSIKGISGENLDLMTIATEYLKKSVLYKMIRNIFLYEKVDVKKFCELEYISAPTFSRYRQRLSVILTSFDLKLTRDNQIYGDELKIRNFYFLFFSYGSSEWPFSQHEYHEIETYIYNSVEKWHNLNRIRQQKICLLVFISNIRSSQKHYFTNETLIKLAKRDKFEYKRVVLDYFQFKKNKTIDQAWQELSAIQLFMYKENLVEEELDYESYESYFNEQNFPFIKQSNLLTDRIIQDFFRGTKGATAKHFLRIRQEIDKMHLVFSTCYVDLSIFYYVYDPTNFYYRDAAEQEIVKKIEKIVDELTTSTIYKVWWEQLNIEKKAFINSLYLLVYTLLNELHEYRYAPVKVMVQNSKVFIENILMNKLDLIFGDRIQLVASFRDEPEILITDVYLPGTPEQTKTIFATSFSDFADINNAVNEIKKATLKNFEQREIVKHLEGIHQQSYGERSVM
ncbi:hypothetical protein ATZ33_14630 [Enterococcus silesiacus]|uniref:Mga helix-turn-helix domain-containing protein n=1 Tax=Enterococcus silesiacus TaxID=332949 RepID=A0A0S3KE63_9ENTE|nr:helix-turn-helix domain-containing protein [Enterococcus silesiacus]ALS02568.1 hypothetical protein ATZ33_14630 [Enterococcus silesiacus]OJG93511.1 hypothetical protein RV15_GL000113 [Enterococcus silesiacus]